MARNFNEVFRIMLKMIDISWCWYISLNQYIKGIRFYLIYVYKYSEIASKHNIILANK